MSVVDAVLIGAGLRGRYTYGGYARSHPDRLRIVALAEPDPGRAEQLARDHELPDARVFDDWRDALAAPKMAAAAIVATGDMDHVGPALAALERGYHLLLEKPMAPTLEDCVRIVREAESRGRILQIAHVLRYTRFYGAIAEILHGGRIGRPLTVDLAEHVAHWHMTHSFVRGKFRNPQMAAPIILAKSCHDLDLLVWLLGEKPRRLSSFGGRAHFHRDQAPRGAPERCTDACPVRADCPHDAVALYVDPDPEIARGWPWSDVSVDPSRAARRRALETGRYGRCAFRCDNDVPDHQIVAFEFGSGALASFTVQGLATHETRTIRVSGSLGELRGDLREGSIEVTRHGSLEVERVDLEAGELGHFGGDRGLLDHFTDVVLCDSPIEVRTSGRASLESHVLGYAAEESRRSGLTVDLDDFRCAHGAG